MNRPDGSSSAPSRRGFLAAAGGMIAAAGASYAARAASPAIAAAGEAAVQPNTTEPFFGPHQGGILTPLQSHTYFAAFDLLASKRGEVLNLLRQWTAASARMTAGRPVEPAHGGDHPTSDSGETIGLSPARLTITFGLGAGLFTKDGHDRYGLAARRPAALVDLPRFNGDQLLAANTGGDLSVQACADDPQVAFHAVRQLARLAGGAAQVRWAQTGFMPSFAPGQTPRNLMGFRDGTSNPSTSDPAAMDKYVWVASDGPDWMQGGSYVVVRRIRMALEHWDRTGVDFQERTIGRYKNSGAPLGAANEFDTADLDAADKDGNFIIADNAHLRLAIAANNDGARILRRPYSYNDGVNFTSERWPPWRQGMEYDAGLFFLCYQRDPRTGFMKIFDRMSKLDMLNQFVTHTGGGVFACPRGVAEGEYIGQALFQTA